MKGDEKEEGKNSLKTNHSVRFLFLQLNHDTTYGKAFLTDCVYIEQNSRYHAKDSNMLSIWEKGSPLMHPYIKKNTGII